MQGDVKSKPILFNTAMVQAILDGRKTVTRRVVKDLKNIEERTKGDMKWEVPLHMYPDDRSLIGLRAPYQVGDILWVRETFNTDWCDRVIYKADGGSAIEAGYSREPKWRPSIHMPKEAARIFLKVTDVRVERLQDITMEDCKAEGITDDYKATSEKHHEALAGRAYQIIFSEIWNSTIKKKDLDEFGWDTNPWVFVYEFERCENAV